MPASLRSPVILLLIAAMAAAALSVIPTAAVADPPTHAEGYIPVAVGTPDETTLHYKVMLPGPPEDGPYPTVIDYSGYVPAINVYDGLDDRFHSAGYAVVGLNIRGTGCSGGKFDYFEALQASDGADAIEWLATQDWSDGHFAMVGKSYPGITQSFVAAEQPAHLDAIVPGHIFGDLYRDVPFPGGIMNVTFAGGWSAQRAYESFLVGPEHTIVNGNDDPQCQQNQADHAPNAAFNPLVRLLSQMWDGPIFRERSPWEFADRIQVPTFLIESWQDEQVGSRGTHLLERMDPEVPWKFLATNGDHGEYYGPDVFPHILRFLDYYVKGEVPAGDQVAGEAFDEALARYEAEDPVTINWENGAGLDGEGQTGGRNAAWTATYADWPAPQQVVWDLSLTDDGQLIEGPTTPGRVDYTYAPGVGEQARGGYDIAGEPQTADWNARPPAGTFADFTSDPLEQDAVLLGSASLDVWLSSTAADTDLEVTLTEVRPDGQEVFIQQGWLRATHRVEDERWSTPLRPFQTHALEDSAPLLPNTPALLRVEIFPFGHTFRAGSQIRVAVTAPHTRPDLWGFALLPAVAQNTIHTGGAFASTLRLPLLEGEVAGVPELPPCGSLRNQPCRPELTSPAPAQPAAHTTHLH